MRFLLFFISFLFSLIFYIFYLLSKWENIFWEEILNVGSIVWISWNLLIESIIFIVIWIIFIILFSPLNQDRKTINKEIFYNILFYIFLLVPLYFQIFSANKAIIILIIIFIFWDICFRILSNVSIFVKEKIKLRYFWLALNYLTVISSLFYVFLVDFSYYLLLISVFSAIFNFQVHKKYWNYISIVLSIGIVISLLFYLILKLEDLYILLFSFIF
jgi:hypothetical protein